MSSTDSPNSNQHSAKRKLNPIFVEALMRWPTGLSGFERQEMVSIPSLLPMHICVCQKGYENAASHDHHASQAVRALRGNDGAARQNANVALGQEAVVRPDLHGVSQGSRKPEAQYEMVEQLFAGPYAEVFSRANRAGWDSFGDEVGKFTTETAA